jgi:hypothetical protein
MVAFIGVLGLGFDSWVEFMDGGVDPEVIAWSRDGTQYCAYGNRHRFWIEEAVYGAHDSLIR